MEKPKGNIRVVQIVVALVVIIIFGVVYFSTINLFKKEGESVMTEFTSGNNEDPNFVQIDARLVSVDPIKGDLLTRLTFIPNGNLIGEDGVTLSRDIYLDLNSTTGKTEIIFKQGERMNPADVTIGLYDGYVMDYPFDSYSADLLVGLSALADETEGEQQGYIAIPMAIDFFGALAGYKILAEQDTLNEIGYREIYVTISRSNSVLFFAIFNMAMQWLLALSALLAMYTWVIRGRKIEVTMFGWMGALLFALIPLRNAMPNVPPFGALADYLAFFWAEFLVVISLIISLVTWAFFRAQK
jgi:hypothetical protein